MKPRILVIVGTFRKSRVGRTVADWYLAEAKKTAPELDFELFDVAEQDLAIFDEPLSPMLHQYGPVQEKLAAVVGAADGFIFVTGEYNHSIPGSLKNFLDYLNAEWNHKPAAYVGYGGMGGARAIEHLVQIMAELRVASIRDYVMISTIWAAMNEDGTPRPEHIHGDIAQQLKELTWWTNALKAARG